MKYGIAVLMWVCAASVNGGYVQGVGLDFGYIGTLIVMWYTAWCFSNE